MQEPHLVTVALLTEVAELAQILAHLTGVAPHECPEFLRGDAQDARPDEMGQGAVIAREPRGGGRGGGFAFLFFDPGIKGARYLVYSVHRQ